MSQQLLEEAGVEEGAEEVLPLPFASIAVATITSATTEMML